MPLLTLLLRWLDRRIDARIAAHASSKPLPVGLRRLADEAARNIRDVEAVGRPRGGRWMGD